MASARQVYGKFAASPRQACKQMEPVPAKTAPTGAIWTAILVRQRVRQTLAHSLAHKLLLMISTVNGVRRAGALLFLIRNYKYYILYKKVVRQPGAPHLLWESLIKGCAPRTAPRSGALSGALLEPLWRASCQARRSTAPRRLVPGWPQNRIDTSLKTVKN